MLISGEISLIAIYLVFFPLIIENKNKEYYLGYRISDWILYKRKTKKYNDISVIWMTSIFIIISSIIFVLQKNFIIVFAEFIIFMIILSTKTIKYIIVQKISYFINIERSSYNDICSLYGKVK